MCIVENKWRKVIWGDARLCRVIARFMVWGVITWVVPRGVGILSEEDGDREGDMFPTFFVLVGGKGVLTGNQFMKKYRPLSELQVC
jgi:hypothetical protein